MFSPASLRADTCFVSDRPLRPGAPGSGPAAKARPIATKYVVLLSPGRTVAWTEGRAYRTVAEANAAARQLYDRGYEVQVQSTRHDGDRARAAQKQTPCRRPRRSRSSTPSSSSTGWPASATSPSAFRPTAATPGRT